MSDEKERTALVTKRPCGCLCVVVVNEPVAVAGMGAELARELKAGRVPVEVPIAEVRAMPWHCEAHPWGWRNDVPYNPSKPKPVFGQPETGRRPK